MIFSTIDIGTNTILMVTLSVEPGGTVRVLGDEHAIARLGRGVDATRTILPETFGRLEQYLLRYRDISASLGAERIVAFGTSALRDARNRAEFIAQMEARTGIRIEVLSGDDEAQLTYRGALFGFPAHIRRGVIDIGGGSTEIALGTDQQLEQSISIDVGAVRITERFFPQLPPTARQVDAAREFVRQALLTVFDIPSDAEMVGVAGTVTTFGAIVAGLQIFDADELNGLHLAAADIERVTESILGMRLEQIKDLHGVHPDRADVLPGGALVLREFMRMKNVPSIVVSTRGVRYGVAMHEIGG